MRAPGVHVDIEQTDETEEGDEEEDEERKKEGGEEKGVVKGGRTGSHGGSIVVACSDDGDQTASCPSSPLPLGISASTVLVYPCPPDGPQR